ncbi:Zinc finger BED domain-containing protein 5 [Acipenser ruthenus]|uniref:Zinc finger BED domain-containing protein 5 n=1 Tax=Acipenser ruthenus TaxID=7906 RepID=A0A444U6V0_ACIRT|nr:Zinc finger BED domain-containing protein 5 [Acipenser ruthenus]
MQLPNSVKHIIREHLQSLKTNLCEYFPVPDTKFNWIRNPFASLDDDIIASLTSAEQDSLVELSCDSALKQDFSRQYLTDFWLKVASEYPALYNNTVPFLMPFPTAYLCETGFSALLSAIGYVKNV